MNIDLTETEVERIIAALGDDEGGDKDIVQKLRRHLPERTDDSEKVTAKYRWVGGKK